MIEKVKLTFGCDPEFFFRKDGKVIGAEKVLMQDGFVYENGGGETSVSNTGKIIIDGVQAEMNPRANTDRKNLVKELHACFLGLNQLMAEQQVVADFKPLVEITKDELDSLSDKSRQFGCAPSKSTNGKSGIPVDPRTYMFRPAGGHIHIGSNGDERVAELFKDPESLVHVLDVIVGNTCVLLDRDEGNIERRKVYGRAGEFRTPSHGLEYRTLSNFWLKSPELMSMVMGLTELAVSIHASGLTHKLVDAINLSDVHKAINENDYDLALDNFSKVVKVLKEIVPEDGGFVLHRGNINTFYYFVSMGTDYWFKGHAMEHWMNFTSDHSFEEFLSTVVNSEM